MTTRPNPYPDRPPPPRRHPIRVVLVDRDHVVRDAVADLLELDPTIHVVGQADTLTRAQALLPGITPDVVSLDPRLPDGDGLDLCRNLHAANTVTRCPVLTSEAEPDAMLAAVQAGAAGYMIKGLTELAIADAVRAIAAGQSHLDSRATPVLMQELRRRAHPARTPAAALTTTEMTVMLLLAEGLTDRQIADRLFFTENTIRGYVARLTRKLGLSDRAQAALHAAHLSGDQPVTHGQK